MNELSINTITVSGILSEFSIRKTARGEDCGNGKLVIITGYAPNGSANIQRFGFVAWDKQAREIARIPLESKIRIKGRLWLSRWQEHGTGKQLERLELIACNVTPISNLSEFPTRASAHKVSGMETARALLAPPSDPVKVSK
jgi:hypothetical protein